MGEHGTGVRGVAVQTKLKVGVAFDIIDYLDRIASLSMRSKRQSTHITK